MNQTELKTESIREFCMKNGFNAVSKTVFQTKENNVPYIHFMHPDSTKNMIVCFSKNAGSNVTAGTPVNRELISSLAIGYCTNGNGEQRVKLVSQQSISLEDLLG